jgi:hypothetical protein
VGAQRASSSAVLGDQPLEPITPAPIAAIAGGVERRRPSRIVPAVLERWRPPVSLCHLNGFTFGARAGQAAAYIVENMRKIGIP